MNRFLRILVLLFAVSVSSAFAQTSTKQLYVPVPREGFPINVQKLPDDFPESVVLFMAIDLKNKVAPEGVNVCVIGPNITDEFKLTGRGAQRNYSALQLSGDLEITISKAGYKTVKEKIKIEGGSAVAIRLDKGDTAQQKTYKVGDYYNDGTKEGVVFWVDATGKHGKIVSMQQTSASWSSDEAEQKCYIGALSKTDGEANMKVVMGRPNWKANYPAFAWCANLGEGWYLPAIDELEKFTLNDAVRNAVNRTLAAKSGAKLSNVSSSKVMWYWSSTEREYQYPNREYSAQLISMDAATIGRARKSVQGPTRAVAQF